MQSIELPHALIEAVRSGRVVLFLGAGASLEAKDSTGRRAPSSDDLCQEIAEKFLGKKMPKFDLQTVSEMASRTATSAVIFEYIRDRLRKLTPSNAHNKIPMFRWHTIATTNYDTLIEDAFGKSGKSFQELVRFTKDAEPIETRMMSATNPLQLLKLHGCIESVHDADIPLVLDAPHYERYLLNRTKLFSRLEHIADELPFLFIGYSLSDPHIANLIHRLDRTGKRPEYFVVSPGIELELKQLWTTRRITTIDAKFGQFMDALDREIPQIWRQLNPGSFSPDMPIRRHFRVTADPSDQLAACLASDVLHIHGGLPTREQNAKRFYKGYDTGFGAIVANLDVPRKVADDLIYAAAEEAAKSSRQSLLLLAGPGGSGKTIVLKRVIWELAVSLDMLCLWQEASGAIRPEAIRELFDLTGKPIILAVDNVAGRLKEISQLFSLMFAQKIPLVVIGAERAATWNTTSENFEEKWPVQWFRLEKLLSNEVVGLVTKLREHGSLGHLAGLTEEEQLEAFQKADRHLLVALHELTLGEPFEKIILDEFNSIAPSKAQMLYLDVCTLNQFSVPVRAGIIKRTSAIPYSQYEREFFDPLEGVVLTSRNQYSDDYQYAARHSKVAQLVFKQVLPDDSARVQQLERFLESLDSGYSTDREALFQLVRARNFLELVKDVSWGRHFYEVASRRLSHEGFVWQHWAIFEMRHENGDLALAEEYSNHAVALDSKSKSFVHTQAEIALQRARLATNPAQKTLYRQQSYSRLAKITDTRNSLADYTRCKLKLDELRECSQNLKANDASAEAALLDAVKDAQVAIDKAIEKFPQDPEIARLEAELLTLLNDTERAIAALERAWQLGARGSGIAIQLSRIYETMGNSAKAKSIVEEALAKDSADRAANLRMTKLLVSGGDDPLRALVFASRSYTAVDRNYDARFLHAQLVFWQRDGEVAKKLFSEVNDLAPPGYLDRTQVNRTKVSDHIGLIDGRVIKREQTFLFFQTILYPDDIFVHISDCPDTDWEKLKVGTPIKCRIGFNRRGPVGYDVSIR